MSYLPIVAILGNMGSFIKTVGFVLRPHNIRIPFLDPISEIIHHQNSISIRLQKIYRYLVLIERFLVIHNRLFLRQKMAQRPNIVDELKAMWGSNVYFAKMGLVVFVEISVKGEVVDLIRLGLCGDLNVEC